MLHKNPGFTVVAVLALALGIGATTAIFTVVDALLLRPLPYPQAERLTMIWEKKADMPVDAQNVVSPANYLDWKAQNTVFEKIAVVFPGRVTLADADEPVELQAQVVTAEFFPLLRTQPFRGRLFKPTDDRPGAPPVVIISHRLWQQRFGGEDSAVGRSVRMNGAPRTIIGVLPPGFFLLDSNVDIWQTLNLNLARDYRKGSGRYLWSIARLKPDVTLDQARHQMNAIAQRLELQYPEFNKNWSVNLVPLREQFTQNMRQALYILFGAVGCLLLIACANVANLLLAKATSRQREMAIRISLGAGRRRVIRQLLTESVLLSLMGAVLGVLLAFWGVKGLLALSPKMLVTASPISINGTVLGFSVLLAAVTGILFGMAPAFASSRANPASALKEGGRTTSAHGKWLRQTFVVAQLSLTVVLLVGAALLLRSFLRLQSVDPGLSADHLLTFRVSLSGSQYREQSKRASFFSQAVQQIEALPGVRSASAISFLPFTGLAAATGMSIEGDPPAKPGEEKVTIVRTVMPNYFRTVSIPLLRGRAFTDADNTVSAPHRFIVNEAFVRKFLPDKNPLEQSISVGMDDKNPYGQIIGVVGDVKEGALDKEPMPTAYYNHAHLTYNSMVFVVRTERDPMLLAGAMRKVIRSLDPEQPIAEMRPMETVLADTVSRQRFSTVLLVVFASVALALAAIGIYGVLSYMVVERTQEMGVRLALGAQSKNVLQLILGQGMRLAVTGLVIGVMAALAVTRLLRGFLFGITPVDPIAFTVVSVLLLGVSLLAIWLPARRASRVDPMVALRYE